MSILKKKIEEHIKLHYPNILFKYNDVNIKDDVIIIETNKRTNGVIKIEYPLSKYLKERDFKKSISGDTFYHFVPLKYVFKILEERKIRLYNLNKYLKDDSTEFSYLLERLGIELPKPEEQIKKLKENNFVFSCTTNNILDKHWQRFGKTEKVVCLKLKINFTDKENFAIDIRKVAYSTELSKLLSLQEYIFNEYNKRLEIQGWSCFAKFTKRGYFDWEEEIRLCFDNIAQPICNQLGMPSSREKVYCDNGTSYIELPLMNDYFELKVQEVQVRKDNWQGDLKSFCKSERFNFELIN